jgi:hypothetical protein
VAHIWLPLPNVGLFLIALRPVGHFANKLVASCPNSNVLLNPQHREALRVVVDHRKNPWDRRLLE